MITMRLNLKNIPVSILQQIASNSKFGLYSDILHTFHHYTEQDTPDALIKAINLNIIIKHPPHTHTHKHRGMSLTQRI